nr:MAG TPA: hypothetical protein [Caudoviricetes sp.]
MLLIINKYMWIVKSKYSFRDIATILKHNSE